MPLVGSALSEALFTSMSARGWFNKDAPDGKQFCDDLADTIVTYFVANAVVLPTTLGVPTLLAPSGGGPVTGVGSIE